VSRDLPTRLRARTDVITVLQPDRVVKFAAPQAQVPQGPLDHVAVADDGRRLAVEKAGGGGADGDQPVDAGVDRYQGYRTDDAADQGRVIADDGILHHVGQQEDHDEVEGVHAGQARAGNSLPGAVAAGWLG
jgi:hypothetical protein